MFPGLPTSLSGAYVIESTVDEECQANLVTRFGKPWGIWYDDTTPDLEHWLALGLEKYTPLHQKVLVCVPLGRPHHHYPAPVISVYEAYIYGMGCPPAEWLPLPRFDAYCVQHSYPGTHGTRPPTVAQRDRLLAQVRALHPRFIFLF